MNVAQLQLALGRLSSPAAAEKPDLAGYEAQGEFPGCGWGVRCPWLGLGWDAGPGSTSGPTEVGSPCAWGYQLWSLALAHMGVRAQWAMQVLGGTDAGPVSPGQGRGREAGDGLE